MELTTCDTVRDVAQCQTGLCTQALLTLELLAIVGDIAHLLLCVKHMELVAGRRCAIQTEYDSGLGRLHVVDALVALVEHSLDTAPAGTGDDIVTDMERTVAD